MRPHPATIDQMWESDSKKEFVACDNDDDDSSFGESQETILSQLQMPEFSILYLEQNESMHSFLPRLFQLLLNTNGKQKAIEIHMFVLQSASAT